MVVYAGGPCIAIVEGEQQCGATESSWWYGAGSNKFCARHRTAWKKWRLGETDEPHEPPSNLAEVHEMLGSRFCEPSNMAWYERYNEVAKSSMDYCVQGTFKFEGMVKGHGDIRWLAVEKLAASGYSKEQFETLTGKYIKELQKRFKRDAKAFKSEAQQRRARK